MAEHFKVEPKPKIEYTKIIIGGVLLAFYVLILFGIILTIMMFCKEKYDYATDILKALCTFVGVPLPVAIGFYCWKARGENIPKQYQRMLSDITDPRLKEIFLSSLAGGNLSNLDLTKNQLGTQYNNMVADDEQSSVGSCNNANYEPTNIMTEIEEIIYDEL